MMFYIASRIADNPTNAQLPGSYDDRPLLQVPVIEAISLLEACLSASHGTYVRIFWVDSNKTSGDGNHCSATFT